MRQHIHKPRRADRHHENTWCLCDCREHSKETKNLENQSSQQGWKYSKIDLQFKRFHVQGSLFQKVDFDPQWSCDDNITNVGHFVMLGGMSVLVVLKFKVLFCTPARCKDPKHSAPGHLFICYEYQLYIINLKVCKRMHTPGAQIKIKILRHISLHMIVFYLKNSRIIFSIPTLSLSF